MFKRFLIPASIIAGGSGILWELTLMNHQPLEELMFWGFLIIFAMGMLMALQQLALEGTKSSRLNVTFLLLFSVGIFSVSFTQNEIDRSKKILEARQLGEMYSISLVLRADSTFEIQKFTTFHQEKSQGNYRIHGDTLYFHAGDIAHNYLPRKAVIDQSGKILHIPNSPANEDSSDYHIMYSELF